MRRQMGVPVAAWGVREVCDWAEHIGLGQYRKRFLHHCIGGGLLLDLTEYNLKVSTSGHSSTLHQCVTGRVIAKAPQNAMPNAGHACAAAPCPCRAALPLQAAPGFASTLLTCPSPVAFHC